MCIMPTCSHSLQAFFLQSAHRRWSSDVGPAVPCVRVLMVTEGSKVALVGKPREKLNKGPEKEKGFAGACPCKGCDGKMTAQWT